MSTVSAVVVSNAVMVVRFSPSTRVTDAPVAPLRISLVFAQKETSIYSSGLSVNALPLESSSSVAVYEAPLVDMSMITFSEPLSLVKGNLPSKSLLIMLLR